MRIVIVCTIENRMVTAVSRPRVIGKLLHIKQRLDHVLVVIFQVLSRLTLTNESQEVLSPFKATVTTTVKWIEIPLHTLYDEDPAMSYLNHQLGSMKIYLMQLSCSSRISIKYRVSQQCVLRFNRFRAS